MALICQGRLKFEGEYINGKRNGKGKEYCYAYMDTFRHLEFEGEYLNGERNGKGKYYIRDGFFKDRLEFEGEFRNGKKWNGNGYDENGNIIYQLINGKGKGKEYNEYGEFEFEGEYLNGEKHGKGKEYDHTGKLIFEGEYLNGQRNGKGKEYDENDKLQFEGKENSKKEKNGTEKDLIKMEI